MGGWGVEVGSLLYGVCLNMWSASTCSVQLQWIYLWKNHLGGVFEDFQTIWSIDEEE